MLAAKAREKLKSMVEKSDLDGYVIQNDTGKLNSKYKTSRVPFP